MRRFVQGLARDDRGATLVEFAFVAPVMLLLIMGLGELTYGSYVQAILTGAIQKAGRDSSIQGASGKTDALDAKVMAAVRVVAHDATYSSSRLNYANYASIAPESFSDDNNNGVYDPATECFTDINGNKKWDADPGTDGQGGANDVVVYSITVTYPRLFPLGPVMGWGNQNTIVGKTSLKNQPYAAQNSYAPKKVCP